MRIVEPIGIAAAGLWLPAARENADDAVRDGRLLRRHATEVDHPELPAAGADEAPPDMAVAAARPVLKEAGVDGDDLDVLCHAWMYYQGHDLWSPAHYLARELGASRAVPVGVQQICNGGCAAIELAAARIGVPGERATRVALVTTADRFSAPGFDRWGSDYGVAYGDGATAVVLRAPAAEQDRLLLSSVATVAAPELEQMHRGADPFAPAARTTRDRIDMRATKRAFLREHGNEPFLAANRRGIQRVVAEAVRDAGDPPLRYAVLPRFGRRTLDEAWRPVLAELTDAELVEYGRTTGHLGAGDAAASLADLSRDNLLAPGESALVFSAGAGFTWSCLVVRASQN